MAIPKRKKKSGHRRDDLDVFMDKENDAAEEWLRNNPAIKKLLDEEGPSGESLSTISENVEAGGDEFSRLSAVANTSEDALNPLELVARKESPMDFVWPDTAIVNRKATLQEAVARLGFAGQDPDDVISRIDAHITSLGKAKSTKTVKDSIDYWTTKVNTLKFFQRDDRSTAELFESKDPTTILDHFKVEKFNAGKTSRLYSDSVTDLWGGEPNFGEAAATGATVGATGSTGSIAKPTVTGTVVNLDEAYKDAVRKAKSAGAPVTVKSIQEWTGVKSDQAAEIMARMDDEGLLGKVTKKGGRYFVAPQVTEAVATDAPAPVAGGGSTEKVVGDTVKPDAPKKAGSGWSKMLGGAATAEKEGLSEAGNLLSRGKVLKGLGRGLSTWSGAALVGILPGIVGGVARGALEANPWGESETASQDREVARMAMDSGALMNRVRLQAEQRASAMQALMSNPQLQAALQRQIRGREMMKTGRLPGDVLIGGRPDEGPFDDPEGLMAMLQGR